jgi:hypothetical protein
LPVDPPVPQPVELLQPAFALRPPLRYWPARTELGEMSEQDLLFRLGQSVHGGFDFGERAHALKVARLVRLRQASRRVDQAARD